MIRIIMLLILALVLIVILFVLTVYCRKKMTAFVFCVAIATEIALALGCVVFSLCLGFFMR